MLRADFHPDPDGLAAALDALLSRRAAVGSPHVDPDRPLDLPATLPDRGIGGAAALDTLAPRVFDGASRTDHPGFLAHMDPPTPWFTWAATAWAASLNQNVLHPDTAPAARRLAALVVDWLAPEFGMGGGHLVPGSTIANLTALWAARDTTGARTVVSSAAAHLSVAKAAAILGMEHVKVPTDQAQRLRPDLLPDLSDAVLVVTAGTAATGALDPLTVGEPAWRHVDAAWAGPLRLTAHAPLLAGIDTADSVSVSAHKWLYQPKDSALVLFADPAAAHAALTFGAGYLSTPNVGLLGSHGDAALPLVATLLAWGRSGIAELIEAGMVQAQTLARLVEAAPELELWNQPSTGVVAWRPRTQDPAAVRSRLTGSWAGLTEIDGETWFRSVAANPLADPATLVDEVLHHLRA